MDQEVEEEAGVEHGGGQLLLDVLRRLCGGVSGGVRVQVVRQEEVERGGVPREVGVGGESYD